MTQMLENVLPILMLIAFGWILRQRNYFSDEQLSKLSGMISNIMIPFVIFNSIVSLDIRTEHLFLSIGFFVYLLLLLFISVVIYKVFHVKRKFFIFFSAVFSFGFMAMPLFSAVFGTEHMDYLIAMGVGHELFVSIVFITSAKVVLSGEKVSKGGILKHLVSPLFCMVILALVLKLTGWIEPLRSFIPTKAVLDTVSKVASLTTPLAMIVVGYRIHFTDKKRVTESFLYVVVRYALTLGLGYLLKGLVFDRFVAPNPYYDYAFFTLVSQYGSVLLTMFVADYCSKEDLEVASNAFVINVIIGMLIFTGFVIRLGMG